MNGRAVDGRAVDGRAVDGRAVDGRAVTVGQWTVEREFSHRVDARAGDPDEYITIIISCSHVLSSAE